MIYIIRMKILLQKSFEILRLNVRFFSDISIYIFFKMIEIRDVGIFTFFFALSENDEQTGRNHFCQELFDLQFSFSLELRWQPSIFKSVLYLRRIENNGGRIVPNRSNASLFKIYNFLMKICSIIADRRALNYFYYCSIIRLLRGRLT